MVGLGFIGKIHLDVLSSLNNIIIQAVFDRDQKLTKSIGTLYNAKCCNGFDDLLRSNIDVLYICTPNIYHSMQAISGIEEGIHVFSEKPMATNIIDAEKIIDILEKNPHIKYSVGFNRRFSPVYRKIHTLIRKKNIIPYVSCIKSVRGGLFTPSWVKETDISGGFIYDSLVHVVDLIEYLLGAIKEVYCNAISNVYKDQWDDFVCIFKLNGKRLCTLMSSAHATWSTPWERFEIIGAHSFIMSEEMERVYYSPGIDVGDQIFDYNQFPVPIRWGYKEENEAFINAIYGNKTPVCNQCIGFRAIQICEAISKSARRNKAISVD